MTIAIASLKRGCRFALASNWSILPLFQQLNCFRCKHTCLGVSLRFDARLRITSFTASIDPSAYSPPASRIRVAATISDALTDRFETIPIARANNICFVFILFIGYSLNSFNSKRSERSCKLSNSVFIRLPRSAFGRSDIMRKRFNILSSLMCIELFIFRYFLFYCY